jgi:glycerophosphoryl diester phosphodiesterase
MGARFIETDLQLTRDARIVAMHDATVDRTTGGRGRVSKMTLAELRGLDAGAWYLSDDGRSFKGERVPTLDEILEFAREADVSFYLELKATQMWGFESSLAVALKGSGELARAVVISFDPVVLSTVRKAEPLLLTGLLVERAKSESIGKAIAIGARQVLPKTDQLTPEFVVLAHEKDLQVVTWTVNEPEKMRELIGVGVDGIITDYPDRLAAILKE